MKINGGGTGPMRPDAARDARESSADRTEQGTGARSRVDSVEISDAGRARAAEIAEPATGQTAADARRLRLHEVRQRVLAGAYDTDAVVAEVARRMLDRGDLQPVAPAATE